jgi:hypothetical protein
MESLQDRTWIGVKGKSPDAIFRDLDLRSGMASSRRGYFALQGALSDPGWYLIDAAGWNHRLIQGPVLIRLSAGCEVLTCTVDEGNLASAATGWKDGRRVWSVTYAGEDKPGEIATEGELPSPFSMIHQDYVARSRAPDAGDLLLDPLFEIAIEVVHNAIGFRADEASAAFDGRFVALEAVDPTIVQRLFGG